MKGKKTYHIIFAICFSLIIILGGILEAKSNILSSVIPLSLGVSIIFYLLANIDLSQNDERTQLIKIKSGFLSYIIGLISIGIVYLISLKLNLIDINLGMLIALSILIISYPLILFLYSRLF